METLELKYTDDEGTPEKTREEVRPGSPYIVFSTKPSIQIVLDNPTQRSGMFRITTGVSEADTVQSLTEKICKIIGLKGMWIYFVFLILILKLRITFLITKNHHMAKQLFIY